MSEEENDKKLPTSTEKIVNSTIRLGVKITSKIIRFDLPPLLKWHNEVIGHVLKDGSVHFLPNPQSLDVQFLSFPEQWNYVDHTNFISERIPPRSRRDIKKILEKSGIVDYSLQDIIKVTRGFNAKDLLWYSYEGEEFDEVMPEVFKSVFMKKEDLKGHSVHSPEGLNVKRYSVQKGRYGILKSRLHPYSSDVESEVAVYKLARLWDIPCCSAWLVTEEGAAKSFSRFEYDFTRESILHVRHLIGNESTNIYESIKNYHPKLTHLCRQMILLDFVTAQTDRHMSNFAVKLKSGSWTPYPLYDNGRSLFFENDETFMRRAVEDVELYSTEFGSVGTYWDHVGDIMKEVDVSQLINLNTATWEVEEAYRVLPRPRRHYAVDWTMRCIELIREKWEGSKYARK